MTTSKHVIRCRETGQPLANKLDGGTCVCKPGECEMRKLRDREGDYAKVDDGFDGFGFAIGLATGFPISPRGVTAGSIIGALLHPTEQHAPYDVTSATPTPSVPSDDTPTVTSEPTFRASDPLPVTDPPPSYSAPERVPDATPSYSAPDPVPDSTPSYTAPDPSPSSGGDSGGGGGGGGGDS